MTIPPVAKKPRVTPIRIQLAELADAARANLFAANTLMTQLVQFEPEAINPMYVSACIATNTHLTRLLNKAPTMLPEQVEALDA